MSNQDEKLEFFINTDIEQDYSGEEPIEIAKIVDVRSSKDIMYIDYDKNLYEKTHQHACVSIIHDDEGHDMPYARVDDEHRACLYDKPYLFFALMLHELGHFQNRDFANEHKGMTPEEIRTQRTNEILEGKVQTCELNADSFAVKHIGKNRMLQALDYLIKKRRQRQNDPGKELAIKEFELRKKAIQKAR